MGLGLYPVFEPRPTPSNPVFLGEMLGHVYPALDRIADRHGLVRLSSFADARVVPPSFRGHPNELDGVAGPRSDWYRPEDGVAAATALADLIASDKRLGARFEHPRAVVEELRALAVLLARGQEQGASFRLLLG